MLPSGIKVYIAKEATDLRKSYDGLGMLVHETLEMDPLSGYVFVFFNRRANQIKALYWDRNGFCIWQKRLEKGKFRVPSITDSHWEINFQELQVLLAGFSIKHLRRHTQDYSNYVIN